MTFPELLDDANNVQLQCFTHAYVLQLIGDYLMPNTTTTKVYLMYLLHLLDFEKYSKLSWGFAVLGIFIGSFAQQPTLDNSRPLNAPLHLQVSNSFLCCTRVPYANICFVFKIQTRPVVDRNSHKT